LARGAYRCHADPVSDSTFYSDRTAAPVPRVGEEITANAWRGLVVLVQALIADGSLARDFPSLACEDGDFVTGTEEVNFLHSLRAHVPEAGSHPLNPTHLPSTTVVLDILDFVALHIDEPSSRRFHQYFGHEHLFFRRDDGWTTPGQAKFRSEVDLILARNGIAFTFGDDMRMQRLGPPEARKLISDFKPKTGDSELDTKLRQAMVRFQSRTPADRQDALEKLWDAFERLKTLESPSKKASVAKLLARAVPLVPLQKRVEAEFVELTAIGNSFAIRHHERGTPALPDDDARDYLFIRLAALIAYVLRRTGRMAQ
jgi:hypothetical protein